MNWIGYYIIIGLLVAPVIMWWDLKDHPKYKTFQVVMSTQDQNLVLFFIYLLITVLWLPVALWDFIFMHLFKGKNNGNSDNIQ